MKAVYIAYLITAFVIFGPFIFFQFPSKSANDKMQPPINMLYFYIIALWSFIILHCLHCYSILGSLYINVCSLFYTLSLGVWLSCRVITSIRFFLFLVQWSDIQKRLPGSVSFSTGQFFGRCTNTRPVPRRWNNFYVHLYKVIRENASDGYNRVNLYCIAVQAVYH